LVRNRLRLPATATIDLCVLKFFNVKPHGKLYLVVEALQFVISPELDATQRRLRVTGDTIADAWS
jgi:hypothetical protein